MQLPRNLSGLANLLFNKRYAYMSSQNVHLQYLLLPSMRHFTYRVAEMLIKCRQGNVNF